MQHRISIRLQLALCASLLTTGCGQRLLKNYSSLRPKYSHADRTHGLDRSGDLVQLARLDPSEATLSQTLLKPTFRSQNELPGSVSPPSVSNISTAGHSVQPTARLLTPDFGSTSANQPPDRPTPGANLAAPPHGLTGHSLPDTSDLRRVMPRTIPGNLPAATTTPAPPSYTTSPPQELPPPSASTIQITPRNPLQYDAGFPATPASQTPDNQLLPNSPQAFEPPGITPPTGTPPFSQGGPLEIPSEPSPDLPPEERSMLDRLRGLYDDQEEKQKSLWRRNLERLSNPLGVFRERSAEPAPDEVAESPDTPAPVTTTVPVAPSTLQQALDTLILAAETELQTWPKTPSGQPTRDRDFARLQQDLRLLYLIADQPGHAVESIPGATAVEQEFWQELMLSLAHFRDVDELSHEERLTVTAGQLRSATRHLARESVLSIPRLELCSQINSFGRISVFPSNDFEAGQPLLLYAEIENFGTELTARGTQRTSFAARLQILHADSDTPIEVTELDDISDEASSQRSDYFQSFELTVPSHLAAGDYRIQLQLRDNIRNRFATEIIPFQVR